MRPRVRAPDLRFLDEVRVFDPVLSDDAVETVVRFVARDGSATEADLRFVYDRPVLAERPELRRVARLMAAVPALNYALFAARLVLDFPLPAVDRRHLERMALVTAREQYLNRVVGGHPLLDPRYAVAPADFDPRAVRRVARIEADRWTGRLPRFRNRDDAHVVLASGGKESLLTYGMLRELGEEVHPLFVNESGSHWRTALPAYRWSTRHEPNTRRVWSTVDRVYAAGNRALPIVREDFQRVRCDSYPIQLFTFHVYQLAAVPVCAAAGARHLLMGNEYDEGPWPRLKGVLHWNGVYDQSEAFDRAASRFYASAGLDVRQSSLVRPVSGLLVQRALARRYPELWRTQTSCHATHWDGRTVRPCGRCSKCLGVLLFHLAGGLDPTRCRYRREDVRALPRRLKRTRLKLDPKEAAHCLARLGWEAVGFEAAPHPEVETLRYEEGRSSRDAAPPRLRKRVHAVLAAAARSGAARPRARPAAPRASG